MKKINILIIILAVIPAFAQAKEHFYTISQTPTWVKPVVYDASLADKKTMKFGLADILYDIQIDASRKTTLYYSHSVSKVLTQAGLERAANLKIVFDPASSFVRLHKAAVYRNGKTINQLKEDNLFVQDVGSQGKMFNGEKKLTLLLQNIQIGDIIDFSYTIENKDKDSLFFNEELRPRLSSQLSSIRVLHHSLKPLYIDHSPAIAKPTITQRQGVTEYMWRVSHLPEITTESNIPYWHEINPFIRFSELKDWHEFSQLIQPFYTARTTESTETLAVARTIDKANQTPEEKMIAAVRFAQNNIRYINKDIGESGIIPSQPDITLRQGYGDCKDKALLLIELLRYLGIKAYPGVVNSKKIKMLAKTVPITSLYNHVIVYAELKGKHYWFDATANLSEGDLVHTTQPDFGEAFIISDTVPNIISMRQPLSPYPLEQLYFTYDFSQGFGKPGIIKRHKILMGKEANNLRKDLDKNGKQAFSKSILSKLSNAYSGLKPKTEATIREDKKTNRYDIEQDFILPMDDHEEWSLTIPDSASGLSVSSSITRTMPYHLRYPNSLTVQREIILPVAANQTNAKPVKKIFRHPAFEADYEIKLTGNKVIINFRSKTLSDAVEAKDFAAYYTQVKALNKLLGERTFRLKSGAVSKPFPVTEWLLLLAIGWFTGILTAVYFRKSRFIGLL